ncbi:Rv2175c family DNA-binding protein [Caballeronia sp. Sq4a]|uniref:Rv2175c family DNA-binding protein n=1 Tax=Caballeronia sp. Sq4a TaxID=2878152 RepID=UPI002111226A|nr:Rv2175c family DNA-binding protein [Caballeronia sp. Sq4a]
MQALADKVFDDRLAAMLWLLAATPQLDGIRPIDALATERGHDRVRALLQCLARGSE